MLPTSATRTPSSPYDFPSPMSRPRRTRRGSNRFFPTYLRRLFSFRQMDFEVALWEMLYLCISPERVYRNIKYHKQTKNQWARDDPAFMAILFFCLTTSAIAYGVVYSVGFGGLLRLILWMVFIDFLLVGAVVATALWAFTNRFLLQHNPHSVQQSVEWAYAFDVHCNSFFPMFLVTYVLQLFFIPIVTKNNWISLFVGNTMYLVATSYYVYITFLGYKALPFLKNPVVFLYPIGLLFIIYIFSLFGFPIALRILEAYFRTK
ncbi:UNC-50 [Fimicolochytrium jonesii]|uniref:UNC-50 n=1 Tax=Fimicolochytrium jonesii TaxID=1396493 RepID=UPI0022FF371A|nr:UNC-50 [Fimicolochytrium jonesii]KAI8824906.1 UNC-50 [Fimicolochytrium jonesii]